MASSQPDYGEIRQKMENGPESIDKQGLDLKKRFEERKDSNVASRATKKAWDESLDTTSEALAGKLGLKDKKKDE